MGLLIKIDSKLLKNNSKSLICLLLFTLIVIYITYACFHIHMNIGPIWDTYDLLANAAFYAGKDIGYYDILRPPVMSILTSFYLHDNLNFWPIMFIDGLIFILGSIGLYLFFRLIFDDLTSFLGALLFVTFPIVLTFATEGLTDLPSVCISIWGLFFTVLAVKKNTRLFYLAFPVLMLAFLTRFSSALLIFPLLLFILMNNDSIKSKKDILIGITISILFIIPVLLFYCVKSGNILYILLDFFRTSSISVESASPMAFSYHPDFLYYVKLILYSTWPEAMFVVLIIILGVILLLSKKLRVKRDFKGYEDILRKNWLRLSKNHGKVKLFTSLIFLLIFLFTLQGVHYLVSEVLFFCFLFFAYDLLKIYKFRNLDFDFLFLSWFMAFFIFHSLYVIKDFRYFIGMAPPVAYFLIRGFKLATSQFSLKIRNRNIAHILFSVLLIILTLVSAFTYLTTISETNAHLKVMNENSASLSSWLGNYDPEYKSKVIYSDYWPYTAWDLQMNISKMPIFRDGQVLYTGAKDYNFTEPDMVNYNQILNDNKADYYFSRVGSLNLTNYKSINQIGDFILYERVK